MNKIFFSSCVLFLWSMFAMAQTSSPIKVTNSKIVIGQSYSTFPLNEDYQINVFYYTMYVDAPVCIELYNMFGQRMKSIVPQQNQKTGTYSVQVSVGDLGAGAFIVKVTSGNQVESKQLVVN